MEVEICVEPKTDMSIVEREYPDISPDGDDRYFVGRSSDERLEKAMSESPWTDCGNVQCRQAHESLKAVMDLLGIECDEAIYVVGKAVFIAEEVARLKDRVHVLNEANAGLSAELSRLQFKP